MSEKWVVNASPIIVLGKIGKINLLNSVSNEIVVPIDVAEEIKAGPENDSARMAIEAGNFNIVSTPEPGSELVLQRKVAIFSRVLAGKCRQTGCFAGDFASKSGLSCLTLRCNISRVGFGRGRNLGFIFRT